VAALGSEIGRAQVSGFGVGVSTIGTIMYSLVNLGRQFRFSYLRIGKELVYPIYYVVNVLGIHAIVAR
jgi:hypothetical protein